MNASQERDNPGLGASTPFAPASLPGGADIYEAYWEELFAALAERDANHCKASLAVTKLMAVVVREMAKNCEHVCLSFKNMALRSVLAGLRLLATTIQNAAHHKVQRYSIPFEHPVVAYIFRQGLETLIFSMQEASCTEHQMQLVLRLFRDNIAQREPEIRKQLKSGEFALES